MSRPQPDQDTDPYEHRGVARSPARLAWRRLVRSPSGATGMVLVTLVLLVAVAAPLLSPYAYDEPCDDDWQHGPRGPCRPHWFGQDRLDRDILSRIITGARVSMQVALGATLISLIIGVAVGAVAGFYPGWADSTLMRITDAFYAFPGILLAIGIAVVFDRPSVMIVLIALGAAGWTGIARLVRGQVLVARENDYVHAAHALGAAPTRVIFRHVVPNCLGPVIVAASLRMAGNILGEAGLSFLGIGVEITRPSWGNMLASARGQLTTHWWMCFFPGLAIAFTVLGFNLLGDGLRDALDPRMKVPAKRRWRFAKAAALLLIPLSVALALPKFQPSFEAIAAPRADGIYRIPLSTNPVTLDPAHFPDVASDAVASRIFSSLVRFDEKLRIAPDLAERWTLSEDGRAYTFHLRENARFHNGRQVEAEDVRYSFERVLRPSTASSRTWILKPIVGAHEMLTGKADRLAGVKVLGAHTVQIRVTERFSPFLSQLAMTNVAILPREEVEPADAPDLPFGRRPVGSGPFQFVEWKDDNYVLLRRFDRYFEGPAPLKGLRFRVIKEPLIAFQEYLAGNLEHCRVPPGHLQRVLASPLADQLRSTATLSTYYLGVNMTHSPYGTNVHLRRALNYAINREFLCRRALEGTHVPAKGVLPPGLPEYDEALAAYPYDPEAARRELKAAGYGPDQAPPEIALFYSPTPPGPIMAQRVQSDFKRAGIPLRLRALEWAAFLQAVDQREPDLFRIAWVADYPDADNFLYVLFHSSQHGPAGNRTVYTNPKTDALLHQARTATDPRERLRLFRLAERQIIEDAPWVFLSHRRTNLLVKPYVQGLRLTAMDVGASVNSVDFHKVRFSSGGAE